MKRKFPTYEEMVKVRELLDAKGITYTSGCNTPDYGDYWLELEEK